MRFTVLRRRSWVATPRPVDSGCSWGGQACGSCVLLTPGGRLCCLCACLHPRPAHICVAASAPGSKQVFTK